MTNTPTASTPALLLNPAQAAEALAISPRKLWAMTASGEIPHLRLGRSVRYPVADLEQWIEEQRNGGTAS
jgi:excisionase family DNA binding protein